MYVVLVVRKRAFGVPGHLPVKPVTDTYIIIYFLLNGKFMNGSMAQLVRASDCYGNREVDSSILSGTVFLF